MVRECRPPAREPGRSWLARRSTMATSTPANANSPASISPVGPPPAITTACSVVAALRPTSRRLPPAHRQCGRAYVRTTFARGNGRQHDQLSMLKRAGAPAGDAIRLPHGGLETVQCTRPATLASEQTLLSRRLPMSTTLVLPSRLLTSSRGGFG